MHRVKTNEMEMPTPHGSGVNEACGVATKEFRMVSTNYSKRLNRIASIGYAPWLNAKSKRYHGIPRTPSPIIASGAHLPLDEFASKSAPTVYVAATIPDYSRPVYDDALAWLHYALPRAHVVPARGRWYSTADWLRHWPQELQSIDLLVIVSRWQNRVGPGVLREYRDLQDIGVPALWYRGAHRNRQRVVIEKPQVHANPRVLPARRPTKVYAARLVPAVGEVR
jgi:hypothetical protein